MMLSCYGIPAVVWLWIWTCVNTKVASSMLSRLCYPKTYIPFFIILYPLSYHTIIVIPFDVCRLIPHICIIIVCVSTLRFHVTAFALTSILDFRWLSGAILLSERLLHGCFVEHEVLATSPCRPVVKASPGWLVVVTARSDGAALARSYTQLQGPVVLEYICQRGFVTIHKSN